MQPEARAPLAETGTAAPDEARDLAGLLARTRSRLAAADAGLFTMTRHVFADTGDPVSCSAAGWWRELTEAGGEGMVVKPADGLVRGPRASPSRG